MQVEKKVEEINLVGRVELTLIKDMPSMRKYKGDTIKTHSLNVAHLAKLGYVAKK